MGAVFGGHDPGVCAHQLQGQTLCLSGFTAEGKKCLEQAVSLAEMLKHPHSLAFALMNSMIMHQTTGQHEAVHRVGERLLEISEKYNFPPQRAHALLLCGWARAIGSDSAAGLELMEAEYPRAIAIGPLFRYYAALLAEARIKFEKFADALGVIKWALDTISEPGIGAYLPELYRLKGICMLRLDAHHEEEAMSSFRMAVDISKQQNAPLFQLRAAISMAGAAGEMGQPERGMHPLRDLCANLPEGFDASELREAKQLLSS
jgi:predicted ATPase